MAKKALFFAPTYYTSPYQGGGQHYARAFAKLGFKVLYISNPISPLHRFFSNKEHYHRRLEIHRKGGGIKDGVRYYVPHALIVPHNKPILSSRWVADNWYRFSDVLKYIDDKGFSEVDLIWIDAGSPYWFVLDHVKHRHSVMRIPDYTLGFKSVPRVFLEKEREMGKKVDLVVMTSSLLKEKYAGIIDESKIIVVPNGLDVDKIRAMDTSFPPEFENIPEPRVIYVGYVREWFDVPLIKYAAQSLPHVQFVIIGDVETDISPLKGIPNVHFLGSKPHDRIGQFLSHSHVGIIPFRRTPLVEFVHPLKLYEYLAFGLPTVTTYWKEMENLKHLALVSKDAEQFVRNVEQALKMGKVKVDVEQFDWKQRAKTILEKLHERSAH